VKSAGLDNIQSEMKQCLWTMSGQQCESSWIRNIKGTYVN